MATQNNTLNTRIKLKYSTLAEWIAVKDTFKPLMGEVCICAIENKENDKLTVHTAPTVLFKVGDDKHTWGELPWASALAADVYDWAKKSETEFTAWVKEQIKGDIALEDYFTKEEVNALLETNSKADQKYADDQIAAARILISAEIDADVKAVTDTFGDIITHNVAEFATAAQGAKADTAV